MVHPHMTFFMLLPLPKLLHLEKCQNERLESGLEITSHPSMETRGSVMAFDENQHISSRPETSGIQEIPSAIPESLQEEIFNFHSIMTFSFKVNFKLLPKPPCSKNNSQIPEHFKSRFSVQLLMKHRQFLNSHLKHLESRKYHQLSLDKFNAEHRNSPFFLLEYISLDQSLLLSVVKL
ncbi:hypothetical protein EK904_010893 [Melospiza melodia maxima]|nr:hypothetical protein EK904_010893 [Melospiza melodia maxima]